MGNDINLAEKATISSMLLNESAAKIAINRLYEDDFTDPKYKLVFQIASQIHNDNEIVNRINILSEAKKQGKDRLIDVNYLTLLTEDKFNYIDVETYIGLIKKDTVKRKLKALLQDGYQDIIKPKSDSLEISTDIMGQIETIISGDDNNDDTWIDDMDTSVYGLWKDITLHPGNYPSWYFPDLTKITDVLPGYKLIIVAGASGAGKSTFMTKNAVHMARSNNAGVLYISLEMGTLEIGRRITRYDTGIDPRYLTIKSASEQQRYTDFKEQYKKYPLTIIDDCNSINDIVRKIRIHCMQLKTRVVFIDYLGLIQTKQEKGMNEASRIGKITGKLKRLARQLKIDIVLGCQFNREPMKNKTEPKMYHLRDSGAIEQDADLIVILDRLAERDSQQRNEHLGTENISIIVAKNRDGRTGRINAIWHDKTGTIEPEKTLTKN